MPFQRSSLDFHSMKRYFTAHRLFANSFVVEFVLLGSIVGSFVYTRELPYCLQRFAVISGSIRIYFWLVYSNELCHLINWERILGRINLNSLTKTDRIQEFY